MHTSALLPNFMAKTFTNSSKTTIFTTFFSVESFSLFSTYIVVVSIPLIIPPQFRVRTGKEAREGEMGGKEVRSEII